MNWIEASRTLWFHDKQDIISTSIFISLEEKTQLKRHVLQLSSTQLIFLFDSIINEAIFEKFVPYMPLIAWLFEYDYQLSEKKNSTIWHYFLILTTYSIHFISFSASSGNSAELTTTKNLKRSKNKGRKKKAKTKQSQNNNTTETVQETKSQEIKPINSKSITVPTIEEQTNLTTDIINSEDVSTNAENKINRIVEIIPDKQGAGKCSYIFGFNIFLWVTCIIIF